MSPRAVPSDLDRQIATAHRRFVKAMEERTVTMGEDTKETYFAIVAKLVDKLETPDKPLRDILQEMMAEAMSEVLQMMQS
jgi:hypothetical protein